MKNKNKAMLTFGRFVAILCLLATIGCKDDAWDEHYEQADSRLESNILSVLSEDADYSTFVKYLKQTGYSNQLATSQAYTVWAPNNAAFAQVSADIINNPDLLKELIGNHISLFSYNTLFAYNAETKEETLVKMFNDKYVEFVNNNEGSSFGDVNVVKADILTANGILHTIDEVLEVNQNIWGYLNENADKYPKIVDYLSAFNETGFDEANSVKIGTNTLGQTVYDSVFSTTNSYFKIIGNLSSEEQRFTFIGLTDDLYTSAFDQLDDYFYHPVADSTQNATDRTIFDNLTIFPQVEIDELTSDPVTTTRGNQLVIDPNAIVENIDLSNGNIFELNELNYDPKGIVYKPIRYEIENTDKRTIGSITDFSVQKKYDVFASRQFTNVVRLSANPTSNNSNNYFEISFNNVLSASYNINLKFSPIGAAQDTKLKFEFSYIGADFRPVVVEIPPIIVSNLEDGVITIGDVIDIPVYIDNSEENFFYAKLKVIVDVSEPELLLYDRTFGIDYAELAPIE
ncbi:fasciclin domain-containing protein [Algibacter amylolyticus]|nr:fasciclin domain-containing protein [Algibacter amylolyticus]MBB5268712.1 putative surface protein with fasciclin (FAS1) repeats [Algibacter amylolyticus]